jgi:predicted phage terminase large subunit-like protein
MIAPALDILTPPELLKQAERIVFCRSSLLAFCRYIYEAIEGRPFIVSNPLSREAHVITICRALMKCFRLETNRLIINVPPGYHKSTLLCLFIAWALGHYPDSNFLYISYSADLAEKHTGYIKMIVISQAYLEIFPHVKLRADKKANALFMTTQNGCVAAFGSAGSITGQNGGLPGVMRFSGCIVIDDPIKADDAPSDTKRQNVNLNYDNTIKNRARNTERVPFIFIGQRVHEDDLANKLLTKGDGYDWEKVILTVFDEHDNVLYPENFSKEAMLIEREVNPYNFWAQQMQNPIPAGGSLFKSDAFPILDEMPDIGATFITVDTAETAKNYNDKTVFSFWGVYNIKLMGRETGLVGIHWLDCVELQIEACDIESEFLTFYAECSRFKLPPEKVAIEKKSTGVTLVSTLKKQGAISILAIERNCNSSKPQRFIDGQAFINRGQVSLPKGGRHTQMCITHMSKITANDAHRFDDIADTAMDAIDLALIKKMVKVKTVEDSDIAAMIMSRNKMIAGLKNSHAGRY